MSAPVRSIGLDLSCTSTGIVVLASVLASGNPRLLHTETVKVKTTGLQRCSDVAERVLWAMEAFNPEQIVIEGYGGSFKGSIIPIVELGTVVRYFLRQQGRCWTEPAPTQLKKFVLGKGVGEKEQMMLQVFKRWGYEAPNNDLADAYGLACMGLGRVGQLSGMTQAMLEVLGTLKTV